MGTTASSGGTITSEGSGTVISRGVCWSTGISPTIADNKTTDGAGAGSYSSDLTGLSGANTYYVRAYATNSAGTGYGMALSFTTFGQVPTVSTFDATSITATGATLNGTVNANYLSTIVTFEYGTTTSYGSTSPATQSPVTGNTVTNVNANITGLTAGITYHFRVKASNSLGTVYGADLTFVVLDCMICFMATYQNGAMVYSGTEVEYCGTDLQAKLATPPVVVGNTLTRVQCKLNDKDGNAYNVTSIGTQVWMIENLKTTKYRNGDAIPNVTDNTAWEGLTTGAYCFYNNDVTTYKSTYGALYNWFTVGTGNLCPTGWHVPSDAEWTTLTTFLGGESIAGSKLKETGTTHWSSPNTGATNETGFTALPGGYRFILGSYNSIRLASSWWSSTPAARPWYRTMYCVNTVVFRGDVDKQTGHYVRCIKD